MFRLAEEHFADCYLLGSKSLGYVLWCSSGYNPLNPPCKPAKLLSSAQSRLVACFVIDDPSNTDRPLDQVPQQVLSGSLEPTQSRCPCDLAARLGYPIRPGIVGESEGRTSALEH